jgi:hypothetical protein
MPQALGTDTNLWFEFFTNYGTHMVHELHLGGKVRHVSETSIASYNEAKKNGVDVRSEMEVAFGANAFGVSGGAKAGAEGRDANKQAAERALGSTKSKITTSVKGGYPPKAGIDTDAGWAEWAQSLKHDPMPVKYVSCGTALYNTVQP